MKPKECGAVFFGAAVTTWLFPENIGWLEFLAPNSVGEGRIIAAIFTVGAAVVWFMPEKRADDR